MSNQTIPISYSEIRASLIPDGTHHRAVAVHEVSIPPALSNHVNQLVDTTGDGTGTTQMAAGTAIYKVAPSAGTVYVLRRVNVYIEDNGVFRGDYYGASGALSNGINITVENGSGVIHTFTPQPIKVLGHWGLLAGVDMSWSNFSAGNDIALIRWTFERGGGSLLLDGDNGEFFQINIRDNLAAGGAALVSHLAQVQGYKYVK